MERSITDIREYQEKKKAKMNEPLKYTLPNCGESPELDELKELSRECNSVIAGINKIAGREYEKDGWSLKKKLKV